MNADGRRSLRSIVQALVVFVLLWFAWVWVDRLDASGAREAMRMALGIVGLGTLGYVMENGLRAFKLSVGKDGLKVEGDGAGEKDV